MYATLVGMVLLGIVGVVLMDECPSGWSKFTSNGKVKCYFFEKTAKNHASAKANCKAKGGYLAEPRTEKENLYIAKGIKDRAYIGFVDNKLESCFVGGHTGRPVTYRNWFTNEPNNYILQGKDEDCVEINFPHKSNAKWNDIHCHRQFKSVCEISCPDTWVLKNGKCYIGVTKAATFCNAQFACTQRGGFLAEPRNSKENAIVAAFNGGHRQWIGLNDMQNEGTFVYNTDGSKLTYTNWYAPTKEPNDQGNEDCTEINFRQRGAWNDLPCGLKFKYVCQRNPFISRRYPLVAVRSEAKFLGDASLEHYAADAKYSIHKVTLSGHRAHQSSPVLPNVRREARSLRSETFQKGNHRVKIFTEDIIN